MYFFTFAFNVLYYGLRDFSKRERWKFRKHHLGKYANPCPCGDLKCWGMGEFIPYMLRWIIQTPFGGVRLQKICSSDRERHLHDHPFDFLTIRLWGRGYYEERPDLNTFVDLKGWIASGMKTVTKYHKPWSVLFRRATDLHRLQLPKIFVASTGPTPERAQWTLFFHGPNLREWGFQTEEGWEQWEDYEKKHGIYEANNP